MNLQGGERKERGAREGGERGKPWLERQDIVLEYQLMSCKIIALSYKMNESKTELYLVTQAWYLARQQANLLFGTLSWKTKGVVRYYAHLSTAVGM